MEIIKDQKNRKVHISRKINASPLNVWEAWTKSHLLDQWWAPKPWTAKTSKMEFREGGMWLYAMVGPDGTEVWGRADYKTINPVKSFTATDSFCDSEGKINSEFPSMDWRIDFITEEKGTLLKVELTFSSEEDLNKLVEMGFQEGFTSALSNLDELLQNN